MKTAEENVTKAVTLLESAIARDPKFTLAYCVLGDAQLILNSIGGSTLDKTWLVKAKEAIDAALRISPNSAEAHLMLARYFVVGVEDTLAGEKELAIAAPGLPGRVDIFNLRADIEAQRGKWKEALHDREKATELDPRDSETAYNLADLYISLRRYGEAERVLDHAIATTPQQLTGAFWRWKALIALAKGDAKAAMAAFDSSPIRNSGLPLLNSMIADVFVMERNYPKAEEIFQSLEETAKTHNVVPKTASFLPFYRGMAFERLGRIARFRGDKEKARGYFEAARPAFEEFLAKHPDRTLSLVYIAEIDAALGRKEDAIREGRKAVELERNQNAGFAPVIETFLAVVYVWTGERDAALQQLAEVSKLPAGSGWFSPNATAGDLKLNPIWDDLRSDLRFDKIIAEAAKPVKID
jgi:tetratricopeptide (TPR) repeat protein